MDHHGDESEYHYVHNVLHDINGQVCPKGHMLNFRSGIFEPDNLADSAPMQLYLQCANYVVQNIDKVVVNTRITSHVAENLIEVSL